MIQTPEGIHRPARLLILVTFTMSESHGFSKLSEMAVIEDLDSVKEVVTGAADLPVECVTTVLRCEHSRSPQERA